MWNVMKLLVKKLMAQAPVFGLALLLLSALAPTPSQAAVGFRAASQNAINTIVPAGSITHVGVGTPASRMGCGNINPSIPAGNVGDLLIALAIAKEDDAGNNVTMAGWNTYFSANYPGNPNDRSEIQARIFWRIAIGGDPNTVNQSGGACNSVGAQISRFRGVDQASPFETGSPGVVTQNSGNLDTGSITTTSATAMLLVAGFISDNRRVSQPGSWNQSFDYRYNAAGAEPDFDITLNYQLQATAGAKSISNWDLQGGGIDENFGIILALTPTGGGGTGGLTINLPAGTASGDAMIASVSVTPSTITITPPAGWTQIRQVTQGNITSSKLVTYSRVAGGSEPATYTWTLSSAGFVGAAGGIASFTGVDSVAPVDAEAGNATPSDRDHTAPGVTTTLADGMLVTVHELASSATWTPPGGMTEMADAASETPTAANGIAIEMNYELRPTVGATGTRTAQSSANAGPNRDFGATQSISLKPGQPLVCWGDDFNRANGSPGADWIVSNNSGSFGDPVIFNNRLRLPDASGNVATMATLQRLFPGAGNRIEIEFDHVADYGSGADGIAITLSDASIAPAPGGYGGSLGYAQRTGINGFTGGWLGIGIDEYGNFSNPTEGRQGGPGFRRDSISIRGSGSGITGYRYHAGTAANLSPEVDNNGAASPLHHYRIIVDHSNGVNAWVSVERDTGSGYVMLVAPYDAKAQAGQAAVPANWMLSYTGSTGGATNVHEIDSLQICATSQVPAAGYDHIRIEHDGEGLTCDAEPVVVRACMDANCTSEYTGSVIATLTPDGDTITFTGNTIISAVTARVRQSTAGVAILGANTITPVPNSGVRCFVGATETCNMNFVNSGFRFTDGANPPNPLTVGAQVAGKSSASAPGAQTIALQAVRTDTNTGACVGVFPSGTDVNVEMGSQCNDPATCAARNVSIANNSITTSIANNPNAGVSTYTSVPLRFTTNSQAILSFAYPDVGQISLHSRYNIPDGGGTPTGNYMTGSSNPFVVKPAGFVVTSVLRPDDTANPANTGPADVPYFVKAGTDFKATVEARDINGNVTPNYGNETVPEGVLLTPSLVGGLGLTNNPAITNGTIAGVEFGSTGAVNDANGVATVTNLGWPEVGIITVTPSVGGADGDNYLGAGGTTGTTTGNVGRFIPNAFTVAYNAPAFQTACAAGSFTYVGQGFQYATQPVMTVTAVAAGAGTPTTQNYTGAWWKVANATLTGKTYTALTYPLDVGALPNPDPAIVDTGGGSGTLTFSTGGANLAFDRVAIGAPVAPFDSEISLAINVLDTDGVAFGTNPARFGQATAGNGIAFPGGKEMRWGRLNIRNASGSELSALNVPMITQYFLNNTSGFVANLADGCSAIALTGVSLTSAVETVTADNAVRVKGAVTTLATIANNPLVAGDAGFLFSAPGAGGDGYVDITPLLDPLNLNMSWLRFDWDGDGIHDNDPTGRANFGIYSGSPRQIYWRRLF